MRQLTAAVSTLVIAASGCAGENPSSPAPTMGGPAGSAAVAEVDGTAMRSATGNDTLDGGSPLGVPETSLEGNARRPPTDPIVVGDGALPSAVLDAYQSAGVNLIPPNDWFGRFGSPPGFPEIRGSSARLVEALYRVELAESGDGWMRTDEMSWLLVDDRDRDELLAELAVRVGAVADWSGTTSTEEGAECAVGPLTTDSEGEWTIQGCRYPRFEDLLAIGLTRTAPSSEGATQVDPSVVAVSASLGGRLVFSEVRLGEPGADGATLHLSAQVRFDDPVDPTVAAEQLVADVLPGWQLLRGDGSVLVSGPTGTTWTITATVAVFEWAGRW